MTATLDYLLVEDALPAAVITLNRPQQLNPLSTGLMKELIRELERQSARPEVRAIVLKGAGRAFSAGHDLKEMMDRSLDEERDIFAVCNKLMATVQSIPVPVIAAPHGIATAAGCQLVATCDLAVASEAARFSTPGVHIGLFCSTPMVALSRNVSNKHAMEMLLTGDMISAADAHRIGLVNRVVTAGKASEHALELARQIASKSMLTVKLGKQAFYRQRELNLADAYKLTIDVMVDNMLARDAEEGLNAFIEKRDPIWEDR